MHCNDGGFYAVFGKNISHSLSPQLFRNYFGDNKKYLRVSVDSAGDILPVIEEMNIRGFNITAPFKVAMSKYASSGPGRETESVNTCIMRNGSLECVNTDALALADMIDGIYPPPKGPAAVIGAGGAGRSAIWALRRSGIPTVLFNRSQEKGRLTAALFGCGFRPLLSETDFSGFDVIISAVPGEARVLNDTAKGAACVIDADYKETYNRDMCESAGIVYHDGWEWLVRQALYSYAFMFGEEAVCREITKPLVFKKRIVLSGMMLSGKSTAAEYLKKCGYNVFDLDTMVEEMEGRSVREIFREGESRFREAERKAFFRASGLAWDIMALGGGTLEDAEIRSFVKDNYYNILLWRKPDDQEFSDERPMLSGEHDMKHGYDALLAKRKERYLSASDLLILAGKDDARRTLKRIKDEIDNAF